MEKEFNLSEKRIGKDKVWIYKEEDVRSAVKRLKLRIFSPIFDSSIKSQKQIEDELIVEIDSIFGDKLK